MRATLFLALVALLVAPATVAQDDAKATYDKLKADYDAAMKAYSAESRALQKTDAYKEARKARDFDKIREMFAGLKRPDADGKHTRRFQKAAAKYEGKDDAVMFLTWISMTSADQDAKRAAAGAIASHHLKSAKIGEFVENIGRLQRVLGRERVDEVLETVVSDNPDKIMKATAHYSIAMGIRGRRLSDEQQEKRDKHMAKVVELAPGSILAMRAEGPKFERERLQIGMKAPDIEGKDLDGVAFKLSDYRGKVVVLDFWGDW